MSGLFVYKSLLQLLSCCILLPSLLLIIMDSIDQEEQKCLYGDPEKVIQYMDYQENPVPDNSGYIPELVPGILQLLEVNEIIKDPNTDEWLSNLDIEKIIKQAAESTKDVQKQMDKDMNRFPEPTKKEMLQEFLTRTFSATTWCKAQWASLIFDQWKCIHNFKLKCDGDNADKYIQGTLLTMYIDELSEYLSMFLLEIRKQSGEEYPHEILYQIVLSIQHFMCMNGHDIKLLEYPGLVKMHNTLDNHMKELSRLGVVHDRQQVKLIIIDQENYMWSTGLLGDNTPEKLVNTLPYLIGVHFTLRAVEEHKALKVGA